MWLAAASRKAPGRSVKFHEIPLGSADSGKAAELIRELRGKNFRLFFEILVRLRVDFLAASIASCNV
jgi:hypothetical protein